MILLLEGAFSASYADDGSSAILDERSSVAVVDEYDPFADDAQWIDEEGKIDEIFDPLEPMNRAFFHFNDKLYFWLIKPVARGYGFVVPKPARIGIRNFFHNLVFPVRLVNNLLQGKVRASGTEIARFCLNTTIGVVGLGDPARHYFDLVPSDEDFGQTLGSYGLGEGIYLHWPIIGPSSARDSIGLAGDYFVNPTLYLFASDTVAATSVYTGSRVNNVSLVIGDYEALVEGSLDPYIAVRNAYHQYRANKIRDGESAEQ